MILHFNTFWLYNLEHWLFNTYSVQILCIIELINSRIDNNEGKLNNKIDSVEIETNEVDDDYYKDVGSIVEVYDSNDNNCNEV